MCISSVSYLNEKGTKKAPNFLGAFNYLNYLFGSYSPILKDSTLIMHHIFF